MNITAILCVRNEEKYLSITLRHLVENNIRLAIIDHESTDRTPQICDTFRDHIVFRGSLPYEGVFSLTKQLEAKADAMKQIQSDWFIHQDADEILESPRAGESLRAGIERVHTENFNVISFDEFVFVPIEDESFESHDFCEGMRWYYFFHPGQYPHRLLRSWRYHSSITQQVGGHALAGDDLRVYPENFVMRHYPVLSLEHAREKYATRNFLREELEKGWHHDRVNLKPEDIKLPPRSFLKYLDPAKKKSFDRSCPRIKHFWKEGVAVT